jgi:hypothetical protein
VPSLSVATIADLGRYPLTAPQTSAEFDPERVPVEFFDDLHTRRTVRSDDLDELAGSPSATSSRRCRPTGVGAGVHGPSRLGAAIASADDGPSSMSLVVSERVGADAQQQPAQQLR